MDDYREEFEAPQPRGGLGETVLTEHRGATASAALQPPLADRGPDRGPRRAAARARPLGQVRRRGRRWGGHGRAREGATARAAPARVGARVAPSPPRPRRTCPIPSSSNWRRAPTRVCLVNKGGAVLIDNQVLSPGDDERFEADAFDVSIGFGEVELTINGRRETVRAKSDSPVTYQVTPNGLRQRRPTPTRSAPEHGERRLAGTRRHRRHRHRGAHRTRERPQRPLVSQRLEELGSRSPTSSPSAIAVRTCSWRCASTPNRASTSS